MISLKFIKFTGAGNDFILFDRGKNSSFNISKEEIINICDRRFGIGADGVIIIEDKNNCDFEMRYFNSDGNLGSLCGNGARCAIKYAQISGRLKGGRTRFVCNQHSFEGQIDNEKDVRFFLQAPREIRLNFSIRVFNASLPVHFVDNGSPHVVVNLEDIKENFGSLIASDIDLDNFQVKKWGEVIRSHEEFKPEGTNVNFVEITDNLVKIRTYERGVENETLACGTGSVASAIILRIKKAMSSPIRLETRGGDILTVEFEYHDEIFQNLCLIGPAVEVFKGEILLSN